VGLSMIADRLSRSLLIRQIFNLARFSIALALWMLCCLPAQSQQFDENYNVPINGTRLHFRVRGKNRANPYLLLLHGGPGENSLTFYHWGTSLENRMNVVYLDQRGCGQSQRITFAKKIPTLEDVKEFTIPALIQDLEAVRGYLKIPGWYVLGHDWGGMLAVDYAVSQYSEHSIYGLILMDPVLSFPLMQDALLDKLQALLDSRRTADDASSHTTTDSYLQGVIAARVLPSGEARRSAVDQIVTIHLVDLYFSNPVAASSLATDIAAAAKSYGVNTLDMVTAEEPRTALNLTEHLNTRDVRPELASILVPALVIIGANDGAAPPTYANQINRAIKNSTIQVIEKCGHYPFAEQPAVTTAALEAFVKRTNTRPAN